MNKLLLTLSVVFFSVAAIAQKRVAPVQNNNAPQESPKYQREKLNPEQAADKRVEFLNSKLNLSPDQKFRVKEIIMNNIKEAQQAREENRQMIKETFDAHRKKADDQIMSVLNPEQQSILSQMKVEQKERQERREMPRREMKGEKSMDSKPVDSPAKNK